MTSKNEIKTLGELSVDNKGSYGIAASAVEYSEELYTYLRISDITDDGRINKNDLKSVNEQNAEDYLLKPNDIVFARTGGSTGRNYFYDGNDGQFVYAGFLIKFSIDPQKVNPKYIKYYCQSKIYRDWVHSFNTGSTRGNINAQTYSKMPIILPPRTQQDVLVKVLSSLDDKIELNNKINQNLEQQAQAIYNQLILTQELKEKTLSEIIEITDGTHDSPKVKEEGYYLITSKHLSKYGVNKDNANYISEEDFNKINERSKVDKYDILISMIGTVGLVSLIIEEDIDFAVKNVGIFKTSLQKNYIYFIFSYLLSSSTQNYVKSHLAGTTQKYISLGELRNLKIKIPNEKILASFNNLVHPIYQKIIYNTNEIKILTQLRDTLLPKLMSGEIDVDKVEA